MTLKENLDSSSYSDIYRLVLQQGFDYTQIECIYQCFQKFVFEECNCSLSYFPNLSNHRICLVNDIKDLECIFKLLPVIFTTNFIMSNCFPLCPLECKSRKYMTSITYTEYPIRSFEKDYMAYPNVRRIYSNKTFSTSLGSNLVSLLIYYDSLSYTSITESPNLDFVTLLSNIGGIAGLFLGISLLSIVEIIETILEMVYYLFKPKSFKINKINQITS